MARLLLNQAVIVLLTVTTCKQRPLCEALSQLRRAEVGPAETLVVRCPTLDAWGRVRHGVQIPQTNVGDRSAEGVLVGAGEDVGNALVVQQE